MKKKITVLALILALTLSLTACFGGEKDLYNAFNKMQDVTSMESETELKFTFSGEGFTPEEEMMLQQFAYILNTAQFNVYQKMVQNEEKTAATAETKLGMTMEGTPLLPLINVWVDTDLSEDNFKLVEVFELPPTLMPVLAGTAPELVGKQYLVYDFDGIMEELGEDVNIQEVLKFSKELEPKILEFIEEIQKEFKPDIKMVEKKDSREIDGEKLSIYEIKLDNETLKELVKYTVDYVLENETFEELLMESINYGAEIAVSVGDLTEEQVEEELANVEEELKNALPELKEKFHEFMEKIKDVEILGENGITLELGISKDGYIVHEAGKIDFKLDLASIAKAMGEDIEETRVINFGIEYNTKVSNINSEDAEVIMPETTEENSIKFTDLMKIFEDQVNTFAPVPEETMTAPVELP